MEIITFFAKWILGPLLSVAATVLFRDQIEDLLSRLAAQLGSRRDETIVGTWKCVFKYADSERGRTEVVELRKSFGRYSGWIVPSEHNTGAAARTQHLRPLRFNGHVAHGLFTGKWHHPVKRSHEHGAFSFVIALNNKRMEGMWLGFSESNKRIDCGTWVGDRIDE